ncbi:MAG: hypothetical protein WDA06_09870 [Phenylobacterium sp.]
MIEAVVDVYLKYPYSSSAEILIEMVLKWGMRLIALNTDSEKATIGIPHNKFKVIFGVNPKIGEYKVPQGTEHFLVKLIVTNIQVL